MFRAETCVTWSCAPSQLTSGGSFFDSDRATLALCPHRKHSTRRDTSIKQRKHCRLWMAERRAEQGYAARAGQRLRGARVFLGRQLGDGQGEVPPRFRGDDFVLEDDRRRHVLESEAKRTHRLRVAHTCTTMTRLSQFSSCGIIVTMIDHILASQGFWMATTRCIILMNEMLSSPQRVRAGNERAVYPALRPTARPPSAAL